MKRDTNVIHHWDGGLNSTGINVHLDIDGRLEQEDIADIGHIIAAVDAYLDGVNERRKYRIEPSDGPRRPTIPMAPR